MLIVGALVEVEALDGGENVGTGNPVVASGGPLLPTVSAQKAFTPASMNTAAVFVWPTVQRVTAFGYLLYA